MHRYPLFLSLNVSPAFKSKISIKHMTVSFIQFTGTTNKIQNIPEQKVTALQQIFKTCLHPLWVLPLLKSLVSCPLFKVKKWFLKSPINTQFVFQAICYSLYWHTLRYILNPSPNVGAAVFFQLRAINRLACTIAKSINANWDLLSDVLRKIHRHKSSACRIS